MAADRRSAGRSGGPRGSHIALARFADANPSSTEVLGRSRNRPGARAPPGRRGRALHAVPHARERAARVGRRFTRARASPAPSVVRRLLNGRHPRHRCIIAASCCASLGGRRIAPSRSRQLIARRNGTAGPDLSPRAAATCASGRSGVAPRRGAIAGARVASVARAVAASSRGEAGRRARSMATVSNCPEAGPGCARWRRARPGRAGRGEHNESATGALHVRHCHAPSTR